MANKHAVLSASSSERWLNCPPSARLCENYEDKGSDYAAEGTDAHTLCEFRLKQALGMPTEDPIENLSWYNEEMEECAAGYLKKYEALTKRYEKAAAELERLQSLRTARSQQDKKMVLYIRTLKKQPEVMHDWNDTIWTVMIEKAIVHRNGEVTFVFANGTEIKVGA